MSKSRKTPFKPRPKNAVPSKAKAQSTRAGSHAGRGFRYQDAAAAWLAVRCWSGELSFGGVTPEGLDDAELNGSTGTVFVQMKSRREHLGSYLPGDVAAFIRDLWARAAKATAAPDGLILVIERSVTDVPLEDGVLTKLTRDDRIGKLLSSDSRAKAWMSRTQIVVATSPAETGLALVAAHAKCNRLVASIAFAAVTSAIGSLSDANGLRTAGSFSSLSISDITRIVDDLQGALAAIELEPAIASGLCEAVDFLTPLPAADFYLGIDVQPGHLAAGLLVDRPAARERVLRTLEKRRAVVLVGPSGSGKSGLMWQAAREIRHTVRWFRVRAATAADVPFLLRLTVAHQASAHAPIGFILDDVGRTRAALWDELAAEAATRPGVLLLGSLREEDMFLVERRALTADLHEPPDEELAERLWRALTEGGQTEQPGWREPWHNASGLLLEYAYLLTQGRRLEDVLREQVERRVREGRTHELAILRIASVVGRTGGTTNLAHLGAVIGAGPEDISFALKRLVDEHLLQATTDGRLSSLHQIRANALAIVTHETPPPSLSETIRAAFAAISPEDVESYIARSLLMTVDVSEALVAGAVERWKREPGLPLLSSILRGFAVGDIGRTVDRWIAGLSDLDLVKTQITQALAFALADTEPFMLEKLHAHFEAARRFRAMRHIDHRAAVLAALGSEVAELLAGVPAWAEVIELLTSSTGQRPPTVILDALRALHPGIADMPIDEAVDLLEAIKSHDPELEAAWVETAGQDVLLSRMSGAAPWRSEITMVTEGDGSAVTGKLYHISDEVQPDLHDDVVKMCQHAMALAPSADLAIFQAIDPDGAVTGLGFPIASKRIPRANLPPGPVPLRNRIWMTAAAQSLAPHTRSQFLARAAAMLDQLMPPLERIVDKIIRSHMLRNDRDLVALGDIHDQSTSLTQPPRVSSGDAEGVYGVPILQNILKVCSSDLLRWIDKPESTGALGYANIQELIDQIDKAITEPWDLIGDGPPTSLIALRKFLSDIGLVVGEAASRGRSIASIAPSTAIRSRPGRALGVILPAVKTTIGSARTRLKASLCDALETLDVQVVVHLRPTTEPLGAWPYSESIVIMNISNPGDWAPKLMVAADVARRVVGESARLTLMPAIDGRPIPAWAMTAIETLLPSPFRDVDWLASVGSPAVELPLTETLDIAFGAVLTLSAIMAFGCATTDRHPVESETRKDFNARLRTAAAALREGLPKNLAEEAAEVLNAAEGSDGAFSVAFYEHIRGEPPTDLIVRYIALKNAVTEVDLAQA